MEELQLPRHVEILPFHINFYDFTKSIFFCHFSGKSALDHLRQKLLQSRVFRMIEKFFRRVFLFDPAFIHKQHSRADFPGKAHLVGNDHHCHTLVSQIPHYT